MSSPPHTDADAVDADAADAGSTDSDTAGSPPNDAAQDTLNEGDRWSGYFASKRDAMLAVLREMVCQRSYSRSIEDGTQMAQLLQRHFAAVEGMEVQLVPSDTFAPHVVAHSQAARDSADGCVGLVGHHDTVFPPGTFDGFRIEGDIARGPGVLDMKGGLTVALFSLQALAAEGLLQRVPVRVVIVSDEEVGSPDSAPLLERELSGASCALVFEAGRAADAIITARKGTGGIRVMVSGKAAHAGNHHRDGANAIWALARIIDRVQALTDYERGVTVNCGTIAGGRTRNTVPDHAEANFDLRFVRMEDGEALVERFKSEVAQAAASLPGISVELEGGVARPPLERTDGNVALFQEYAACARDAGLGHSEASLIGGGSDASTTAAIGIPSIDGMGPRGSGFHTLDELIEIPTLMQRAEALTRFLAGRLRG